MKKEDLRNSFELIKPDENAKKRMLDNIMRSAGKKDESHRMYLAKAIPAFALTVVVAAGVLMYSLKPGNNGLPPGRVTDLAGDMGMEDAPAPLLDQFQIGDRHYILLADEMRNDFGLPAEIKEGDIGEKLTDITVSPDESLTGREVYRYVPAGCEAVVAVKGDDGYRLFRFFTFESYNSNQDEDAVEYLELYGINSAEDISKVLLIGHSEQGKMFGVDDIREITDRSEIEQFYGYYSVLKNNSDKYFDRLFNYNGMGTGNRSVGVDIAERERMAAAEPAGPIEPDAAGKVAPDAAVTQSAGGPDMAVQGRTETGETDFGSDMPMEIAPAAPDTPVSANVQAPADAPVQQKPSATGDPSAGIVTDMGGGASGSVHGSTGSAGNALDLPITIRIYNRNGIYFDSVYNRNIGFINRYEVSDEFAAFLNARL